MGTDKRAVCAECERLRTQVEALQAENRLLRERLARARKDSSTSPKPPSSGIVKPPKPPADSPDGKRKIGGQPGHPMHQREPSPPEQVNHFFEHTLSACPCCGGPSRKNGDCARVVRQADVERPPLTVEQHTGPEYRCDHCRKPYKAPMPPHIEKGGLVGAEPTASVAFMKGVCHASFSTIRLLLRDVVGVTISRGHLSNIIAKVTEAPDRPCEELQLLLPTEPSLNTDETGHKDNGDRRRTRCLRASSYTLYHIDPRRSADVPVDLPGEDFKGILGCDCFSACRRYMRECGVTLQFCLAHLIRDVKFPTTLPDARGKKYGEDLKAALKDLFGVSHRRETLAQKVFAARLEAARDRVARVGLQASQTRHGQNMHKRFLAHGKGYFTFVTTAGIEPTNNLAEQAIRFVAIDRHITQGTRSEGGRRWCERIRTVIATCAQQGKSAYAFLRQAVGNWFAEKEGPSLMPTPGE